MKALMTILAVTFVLSFNVQKSLAQSQTQPKKVVELKRNNQLEQEMKLVVVSTAASAGLAVASYKVISFALGRSSMLSTALLTLGGTALAAGAVASVGEGDKAFGSLIDSNRSAGKDIPEKKATIAPSRKISAVKQ